MIAPLSWNIAALLVSILAQFAWTRLTQNQSDHPSFVFSLVGMISLSSMFTFGFENYSRVQISKQQKVLLPLSFFLSSIFLFLVFFIFLCLWYPGYAGIIFASLVLFLFFVWSSIFREALVAQGKTILLSQIQIASMLFIVVSCLLAQSSSFISYLLVWYIPLFVSGGLFFYFSRQSFIFSTSFSFDWFGLNSFSSLAFFMSLPFLDWCFVSLYHKNDTHTVLQWNAMTKMMAPLTLFCSGLISIFWQRWFQLSPLQLKHQIHQFLKLSFFFIFLSCLLIAYITPDFLHLWLGPHSTDGWDLFYFCSALFIICLAKPFIEIQRQIFFLITPHAWKFFFLFIFLYLLLGMILSCFFSFFLMISILNIILVFSLTFSLSYFLKTKDIS